MRPFTLRLFTAAITMIATGAAPPAGDTDLAIIHATVLDVPSGKTLSDQTVLIRDGAITSVAPSGRGTPRATRVLDAHGRLLTPAFIDAHFHLCSISRPACTNPRDGAVQVEVSPEGIASFRRRFAAFYLRYGVTTVRDVGSEERLMPMLLAWMKRSPDAPDYFPVGADL